jgi:hypothetical protein
MSEEKRAVCDYCGAGIRVSCYVSREKNTRTALRSHQRRCAGASAAERAHFVKNGKWPPTERQLLMRERRKVGR